MNEIKIFIDFFINFYKITYKVSLLFSLSNTFCFFLDSIFGIILIFNFYWFWYWFWYWFFCFRGGHFMWDIFFRFSERILGLHRIFFNRFHDFHVFLCSFVLMMNIFFMLDCFYFRLTPIVNQLWILSDFERMEKE